jgi:hypothetical protein
MSDNETTEPKVFIIESLEFEDEEKNLFEGQIISSILKLSKIESKYYYVRTKKEFEKVIGLFYDSNYRYLHISCHGGEKKNSIWTTIDEISFEELGNILEPNLYKKRLFLSACSVVNKKLAEQIIPKTQCYSIIGPKNDIAFRDAAIMWASFYHLMFKKNSKKMLREGLIENMQKVVNTFDEPLNYFSISKSQGFKNDLIKPKSIGTNVDNEEKNIR